MVDTNFRMDELDSLAPRRAGFGKNLIIELQETKSSLVTLRYILCFGMIILSVTLFVVLQRPQALAGEAANLQLSEAVESIKSQIAQIKLPITPLPSQTSLSTQDQSQEKTLPNNQAGCFPKAGSGLFENQEEIKKVWINVGPHLEVIWPKADDTGLILVEPNFHVVQNLFKRYSENPKVRVIHSAIAGAPPRYSKFHIVSQDNENSQSSSLAVPKSLEALPVKNVQITPTFPLDMILSMVPQRIQIEKLKTDMQGFDLAAIKSALECMYRVEELMSEVFADGYSSYEGVNNNLTPFKQTMEKVGFDFVRCDRGWTDLAHGMKELDCYWTNKPKK